MKGEFSFIKKLAKIAGAGGHGVVKGIGDDCALLDVGGQILALTVDASVEGVHFRRSYASSWQIGAKACAVTLSDLASMGAQPRWLLVTAVVPKDLSE
jgi:thiamine-monophosphate kinase